MSTHIHEERMAGILTDTDFHLFNEGTHYRLYEKLGAHLTERDGQAGALFNVWAPNAKAVSVIGDFNHWNNESHPLRAQGASGIWSGLIPGVRESAAYKYHIESHQAGYQVDKTDAVGFYQEQAPKPASLV